MPESALPEAENLGQVDGFAAPKQAAKVLGFARDDRDTGWNGGGPKFLDFLPEFLSRVFRVQPG